MSFMFSECSSLTTIYASSFETEQVIDSAGMFSYCYSLVGENGTRFSGEHVDKEYAHVDAAETPGYFTSKNQ